MKVGAPYLIDVDIECVKCKHEFEASVFPLEYVGDTFGLEYDEECPECGFDFSTIEYPEDYVEEDDEDE